ncbi:MAG: hypothetical protein ACK40G_10055 [Cytophagaceae bacterium]
MRYKYYLIIILLLFCKDFVFGQRENNLWLFGPTDRGIQFDFNTNNPSVVTGKFTPFGSEGCSIITNPVTGQLLYYSDGIRAIDATNRVMPNGNGLIGNTSAAQSGWSCPVPGSCTRYYLFSNTSAYESTPSGAVYYSIVDMELTGNGNAAEPLGDVIAASKNTLLTSTASEAMSIIRGNVRDEYWMLIHLSNSSNILVYRISTAGINLVNTFNTGITVRDLRCIRYSEESRRFCIIGLHGLDPLVICDFNNSNGLISNPTIIPGTPFYNSNTNYYGAYDCEWSPDGTKLYISLYRLVTYKYWWSIVSI